MLILLTAQLAVAQSSAPAINAQLYRPPIDATSTLWTEDTTSNPDGYASARAFFQYANAPFRYRDAVGEVERVVSDVAELDLIKAMAGWPRLVESAAQAHEPHRVAYYLGDLAARFHALWNKGKDDARLRFLLPGDRGLTLARLALVQGVALVIASGLNVLGVTPLEELR